MSSEMIIYAHFYIQKIDTFMYTSTPVFCFFINSIYLLYYFLQNSIQRRPKTRIRTMKEITGKDEDIKQARSSTQSAVEIY